MRSISAINMYCMLNTQIMKTTTRNLLLYLYMYLYSYKCVMLFNSGVPKVIYCMVGLPSEIQDSKKMSR